MAQYTILLVTTKEGFSFKHEAEVVSEGQIDRFRKSVYETLQQKKFLQVGEHYVNTDLIAAATIDVVERDE